MIRVVTYTSANAPEGHEALARLRGPMPTGTGKNRKVREDWHPIFFTAPTEAQAEAKARQWWGEQMEKERQRLANAAKAAERMRARAAA